MTKNTLPSWQDDPKKMLTFQLSKLKAWDSLIGTRLRVNCVTDDTLTLTYVIIYDGVEIAKRRKATSTADHIVENDLYERVAVVEDGAVSLMPIVSPNNRFISSGNYPAMSRQILSTTTDQFSVNNRSKQNMISRMIHLFYYEIVRIIVPSSKSP